MRRRGPAAARRRPREEVPTITSARRALQDDVDQRTHRYLLSMGIRTVCLVLAVVIDSPVRWVLLLAAIVLPYVAVVFANAGREPERPADALFEPEAEPPRIAPGPQDAKEDRDDAA